MTEIGEIIRWSREKGRMMVSCDNWVMKALMTEIGEIIRWSREKGRMMVSGVTIGS